MTRRILAILILLLTAASVPCAARTRLPSAEDRERVVDYTRSLEENPLAKDNLEKRMWLTEWIVKAPALSVGVCQPSNST